MMRRCWLTLLLILGPLLPIWTASSRSLVDSSQQIDATSARLALARALARSPGRADAEEALAIYSELMAKNPSIPMLRERRDLAVQAGRLDIAAADFARIGQTQPLTQREAVRYAEILKRLDRQDEVISYSQTQLAAENPLIVPILVEAIRSSPSREAGFRLAATLSTRYPMQPDFPLLAADLAASSADREKACRLLSKSLARRPGDALVAARLGDLELARGHAGAALSAYEQSLRIAPENPMVRRHAARAAYAAGKESVADALLSSLSGDPTATLERDARRATLARQPHRALKLYRCWRERMPDDVTAAYGEAGSLWATGDFPAARQAYQAIVERLPEESAAAEAVQKLNAQFRDTASLRGIFFFEDSPSRLADISRYVGAAFFQSWFGEHVQLTIGPKFWIEAPGGVSAPFVAYGGTIGSTWQSPEWVAQADYTYKDYTTRSLHSTNTGGASLRWRGNDLLQVEFGYRREDVLSNRDAFIQDIQADVLRLSVTCPVSRRLDLSAVVTGRQFSDSNLQLESMAGARYLITESLGSLFAESRLSFLDTASGSRTEIIHDGAEVTIHPYWTPQDYLRGTFGLAWQKGAYRSALSTSLDSDLNPSVAFSLGLEKPITSAVSLQAYGSFEYSPQWTGVQATASILWTF